MNKNTDVKKTDVKKTDANVAKIDGSKKDTAMPNLKPIKGEDAGLTAQQNSRPDVVAKGHLVSVEYVGTLDSGEEFDNSKNHGPLKFIVGGMQVIKGFDNAVLGMKVGETKKFKIDKLNAYGDINPQMVQKIPLDKIPEKLRSQLKIGGFLMLQSPVGQQMPAKIYAMDKDSVTLDLNHPLAGKDLTFNINIVDISIPDPNDNSHEHDHDCGCGCDDDCHDDCGCDDDCKDCK